MKVLKKAVAIGLMFVMLLSLVACGKSKKPKDVLNDAIAELQNAPAVSFSTTINAKKNGVGESIVASGVVNKDGPAKLNIAITNGDELVDITDVIFASDEAAYINTDKIFSLLNRQDVLEELLSRVGGEQDDANNLNTLALLLPALSSLDLPTYTQVSLKSVDGDKEDSAFADKYKPLYDAYKAAYSKLVNDRKVFTYSEKDETVNIIVNNATLNKMTTLMTNYFMSDNEKMFSFFEKVVPRLGVNVRLHVYVLLKLGMMDNGDYSGIEDFMSKRGDDVKAFIFSHKGWTRDIIKESFSAKIETPLNIKIDTKDGVKLTASREAESGSETVIELVVTPLEKEDENILIPTDFAKSEDVVAKFLELVASIKQELTNDN